MVNPISAAAMQNTEVKVATVMPFRSPDSKSGDKAIVLKKTQTAIEDQNRAEEIKKAREKTLLQEQADKDKEVSQKMLDDLSQDFEILHSVGLSFAKHEDTGRTIVKVMNKDTNELIRELPSEEVLNMAAKFDEMIGLLFDVKA